MACLRKRRDRWIIDFYDTHGKRRWKTFPKGTTKKMAREAMREIEDQLARGIYLPEKRVPLFINVATNWLEQKKLNVRPSTWEMYRGHVQNHFEAVNGMRVNRITAVVVEKLIISKQAAGMNITTLRKIIVTLNQIMQYSVRHRYIDYNPVRDAERPKDQGQVRELSIKVMTPAQISLFFDVVNNPKYKTLFMLAVLSGARQGELLGLKWSDVDWINSQIHVQRSYNTHAWYKPKTKTSFRRIDLGQAMMQQLKLWKMACPPNDLDLIFPSEKGTPINSNNMVNRHFIKALKEAGLQKLRFHDLRHSYASMLIEQGENIKYIQNQLGHSSPTVTLNTYAHLMKPVNQASANRLEDTIFEATGSKMVAKTKKGVNRFRLTP